MLSYEEIKNLSADDVQILNAQQVLNGKYMRMALILKLLKEAGTL